MVPKSIITSSASLHLPLLKISSARTEENPQTQTVRTTPTPSPPTIPTTTTTTKKPSKPLLTLATRLQNVKRKAEQPPSVLALLFNVFDDIINNFIDPPLKPSLDPRQVLSQNFAPVNELPPTECDIIEGTLPPCLDGVYIRNGPNPQHLPKGPYHLFDGDGMLHALRISQNKATLCSRYVKTYKYNIENNAGYPLIPNLFSSFNTLIACAMRGSLAVARIMAGQYNPNNGIGSANTSLALFGNKLFALAESDLPYEIRITGNGDIQTLGRHDFNGKLSMSMTAHPKIDPDTGECFAFRYGLVSPFLTYFRFDPDGTKHPDVPIFSMMKPSFLHDFAITKKHAIFADIQLGMNMNPIAMISRGSPIGSDPYKVSRIGIMPRYARDESGMKWFNVPGINILHAINAWDEEDGKTVTLVAPNMLSVEHIMERMELVHGLVEKVRIDTETGFVTRKPLSTRNLDLGVINQRFLGRKNRFVYAAVGDPMPKVVGVVKIDVESGETVGHRMYDEGCYGGEPYFVARGEEEEEEDDGYLVSYVHDEGKGESRFLVMDARSSELRIVAAVKLPRRVPYGFHGLFVKNSELRKVSQS